MVESIAEIFGGIEVSREIFADYKSNLSIVTRHVTQLVVQRVWFVGPSEGMGYMYGYSVHCNIHMCCHT